MGVNERDWLADQFEARRTYLRSVAYRMLGSLSEAEDAVQEGWLKLSRADTSGVENLDGWLTTVVARVCLDMLRSRKSRREDSVEEPPPIRNAESTVGPEEEALLADSVGLALLVILEKLDPAERIAFVLHDMFGVPFDDIARIVDRTPMAARQLASRAQRRVHGASLLRDADLAKQREVVEAFLAASRRGDFEGLLAVLDPDIVLRMDRAAVPPGAPTEFRGATVIADRAVKGGARAAQAALVNGEVGVIVAPRGRLMMVLRFTIADGKIVEMEAVADPDRLRRLDLSALV